jgi:hypothetical protein
MMKNYPGFQLDPLALSEGRQNVETVIIWAKERMDPASRIDLRLG